MKYKSLSLTRTNIVVTGDSAGGQLTLSTGLAAEENGVILKGLAPVYPSTQELFNIGTDPLSSDLGTSHFLILYLESPVYFFGL